MATQHNGVCSERLEELKGTPKLVLTDSGVNSSVRFHCSLQRQNIQTPLPNVPSSGPANLQHSFLPNPDQSAYPLSATIVGPQAQGTPIPTLSLTGLPGKCPRSPEGDSEPSTSSFSISNSIFSSSESLHLWFTPRRCLQTREPNAAA